MICEVHQIELEMQNEELRRAQAELEASRERYFDLYDLAPVGYFTFSEAGLILEANLTAAALLGVTRDALVKHPLTRFILREDQDIYYRHRRQLFETGSPQACEMRMLRANADPVWVRIEATIAHDTDGTVHGRAVMSDITERKRAEETLRESIQRYELVLEGSSGGVWDWDILHKRVHYLLRLEGDAGLYRRRDRRQRDRVEFRHPSGRCAAGHGRGGVATLRAKPPYSRRNTGFAVRTVRGNGSSTGARRSAMRRAGSSAWRDRKSISPSAKRAEEVRNFLAQTSSPTPGKGFFQLLAEYLATSLGMDFVCIDRLEGDGLNARTVAVWNNGKFEDNVTYALKDTPCGDVVGKTVCCFPASVCQFFPHDEVLRDLRAESYIGVTLWSHTGQPIGLIAVIGRRPLANRSQAESVLKLVADRAAGELERQETEEALQRKRGAAETGPDLRRGRHVGLGHGYR